MSVSVAQENTRTSPLSLVSQMPKVWRRCAGWPLQVIWGTMHPDASLNSTTVVVSRRLALTFITVRPDWRNKQYEGGAPAEAQSRTCALPSKHRTHGIRQGNRYSEQQRLRWNHIVYISGIRSATIDRRADIRTYIHPSVLGYGADAFDDPKFGGIGKVDLGYENGTENVAPGVTLCRFACTQVSVGWGV